MGLGIVIAAGDQPDARLSDAAWVEVYERMGEMTKYRIRYDIDVEQGDFPDLKDGSGIDAGSMLAVIAPLNGKNNYLVKGPVTGQKVYFQHGVGGSYVEVEGSDSSIKMARQTQAVVFTDQTDSDAVSQILGSSQYGFTPDVESTKAGHFETKHTLVQRGSDLEFVRRLARRNGCLFWVDCDSSGTETAHFKRPSVNGDAGLNLDINLDTNNLGTLELSWDVERSTSVEASQFNLNDKTVLDGGVASSPLSSLGSQSLNDITGDTRSGHLHAPVDDAGDLKARGEGALIEAAWFVHAAGRTSVSALGDVLRANTIVKLRGVGSRHSGNYYVAAVRHTIDPSAHHMEFELVRNGWGN
jgi:phage protein D